MVNHKDKPRDKKGRFVETGVTKKVAAPKESLKGKPVRPTVSSSPAVPAYTDQISDMAAYLAKKTTQTVSTKKPAVVADPAKKPETRKPYAGIKTKETAYKVVPVKGVKQAVAAFASNGNVQVTPAVLSFQVKALNGNTVSCRWANEHPHGRLAVEAAVNRPRAAA